MKREKGEKLIVGLFNSLLFVFILMVSIFTHTDSGQAQYTGNDTITISINISEKSMVDINPSNLSYGPLEPGSVGDSTKENIGNYSGIWIENIGSTNVTKIWFNSTYPASDPFGTGDPLSYDAGNMIVIANGSAETYYFPNAVEYPRSDSDSLYVQTPVGFDFADGDIFGKFRNTSYEYFWAIDSDNGNCSGRTFYYGGSPHTKEQMGDVNLDDGTPAPLVLSVVSPGWSSASVLFPNPGGANYCLSVPDDCSKVIFHRWNADIPGAGTSVCPGIGYFVNSTVRPLTPGNVTKGNINVYVPYGVPMGQIKNGLLTVYVSNE